jgi:hypothetical protein
MDVYLNYEPAPKSFTRYVKIFAAAVLAAMVGLLVVFLTKPIGYTIVWFWVSLFLLRRLWLAKIKVHLPEKPSYVLDIKTKCK